MPAFSLLLKVLLASSIRRLTPCLLYSVRELAFLAYPRFAFLYNAVYLTDALAYLRDVLSYNVVYPANALAY
jgi:hypothetical protein